MDDVFHVQRPLTGPRRRQVHAARGISYRQQSSHCPAPNTGDAIEGNDVKDQIDLFSLGNLVKSLRKPVRQHTATTHQVHTGGLVTCKQRRMPHDLPTGTYVLVLREGWDYMCYLGDQVVFRKIGQETCHPCM
jgi:hypothetical protein